MLIPPLAFWRYTSSTDTTAPIINSVSIVAGATASDPAQLTIQVEDNSGSASVWGTVTLDNPQSYTDGQDIIDGNEDDGATPAAVTFGPVAVSSGVEATTTVDISSLGFGEVEVNVAANDASGNVSAPASDSYTRVIDLNTLFDPSPIATDVWYEFSDTSTLFQDSGGATANVGDGDPVGRAEDKSGNDYDATRGNSTERPIYGTDGTISWLDFDGSNDSLGSALSGLGLDTYEGFFAIAGKRGSLATGYIITCGGGSSVGDQGFSLLHRDTGVLTAIVGGSETDVSIAAPGDFVIWLDWSRVSGTGTLYVNGTEVALNIGTASTSDNMLIGSRVGGVYFDGRLSKIISAPQQTSNNRAAIVQNLEQSVGII